MTMNTSPVNQRADFYNMLNIRLDDIQDCVNRVRQMIDDQTDPSYIKSFVNSIDHAVKMIESGR